MSIKSTRTQRLAESLGSDEPADLTAYSQNQLYAAKQALLTFAKGQAQRRMAALVLGGLLTIGGMACLVAITILASNFPAESLFIVLSAATSAGGFVLLIFASENKRACPVERSLERLTSLWHVPQGCEVVLELLAQGNPSVVRYRERVRDKGRTLVYGDLEHMQALACLARGREAEQRHTQAWYDLEMPLNG